jgi:hypothetical protein
VDSRVKSRIQLIIFSWISFDCGCWWEFRIFFWNRTAPSTETIKIGIYGDLDDVSWKAVWQVAILAAKQVNAEGGVLGRNFDVIAEDDDSESLYACPNTPKTNCYRADCRKML